MNDNNLSCDMYKFYSYKEFKAMPDDLKVKYLQYLTDKYEVGSVAISTVLFKCAKSTLSEHLKKHRLDRKIKWRSVRGSLASIKYEKFKRAIEESTETLKKERVKTNKPRRNYRMNEEKEFHVCELCIHSNVCKYEETIKKYKKSVNQMGFDGSSDNISINISIKCKYYFEKT